MSAESYISRRTILKEHIYSKRLSNNRHLRIYLPPGYNELLSYPVIYCQDGEQFFNFGRVATAANTQTLEHHMEPCIIVGIDVDASMRTSEYSPQGINFERYCAFVAEELVPHIEHRFAARRTIDGRIIAGDSLGATVSLHLALDYPQLFQRVLSFSGAYWESSLERIRREIDLTDLYMYMLIGLQETEVVTERGTFNFLEKNRAARALLLQRGAHVAYFEEEGTHKWGFWQKYTVAALRYFFP